MRYASRRDAAERPIIEGLRAVGAKVVMLNRFDLFVTFRHKHFGMEVKTPERPLRKDQLDQRAFLREFEIPIVRTLEDALAVIGAMTAGDTYKRLSAND